MRLRKSNGPGKQNPFLAAAEVVESDDVDHDETVAGPTTIAGPPAPGGAPSPEEPALTLPADVGRRRGDLRAGSVQVVGLHGGAGTSTVSAVLGGAGHDCGVGLEHLLDARVPVVLVARTHARGLELARRAGQQWSSSGLEPLVLLGLVLVADAPERSPDLERGTKRVRGGVPHGWLLEWSEQFRHDPQLPDLDTGMTGSARRMRNHILQTVQRHTHEHASEATTPGSGTGPDPRVHQEVTA